ADQWVGVITRMMTYFPDGSARSNDNRRGRGQKIENPEVADKQMTWGASPGVPKTELAQYLATINLGGGKPTGPYELKSLPRPKGKGTRVIITQYDMPRADTVPHDMDVDSRGTPWYGDQSRMILGKMDPKTGAFTEYTLPPLPAGKVGGVND